MQDTKNPREELEISGISPFDILNFLKLAYKTICIFGVIGLLFVIIYLMKAAKHHEVTAQIATTNYVNNNNINPLGANIERSSLLIARILSPTSFTLQVISARGLQEQFNVALTPSKSINLMIPKCVASVVEFKTFGRSPQAPEQCNLAIFEFIKTTQPLIVVPHIADEKLMLDDDIVCLAKAKDYVSKADKSGPAIDTNFVSTRDEITALKNVVPSTQIAPHA